MKNNNNSDDEHISKKTISTTGGATAQSCGFGKWIDQPEWRPEHRCDVLTRKKCTFLLCKRKNNKLFYVRLIDCRHYKAPPCSCASLIRSRSSTRPPAPPDGVLMRLRGTYKRSAQHFPNSHTETYSSIKQTTITSNAPKPVRSRSTASVMDYTQ